MGHRANADRKVVPSDSLTLRNTSIQAREIGSRDILRISQSEGELKLGIYETHALCSRYVPPDSAHYALL